ncbi:MAG: hypothetical protein U0893_21380 [Chloroflexota bacterium]
MSFRPSLQLGFLLPAILLGLGLLEVCLRLLPIDTFTYRAWEAMIGDAVPGAPFNGDHAYFTERTYGDLAALGNLPERREYRSERFTTDRLGYRNPPDLVEAAPIDAILLGTSFSVGAGMNDDETLAAQLHQKSGRVVYNAASPEYLQATALARTAALAGELRLRGRTVIYEYLERHDPPPIRSLEEQQALAAELSSPCAPGAASGAVQARCEVGRLIGPTPLSPLRILGERTYRQLEDDRLLPNRYAAQVTPLTLVNGHTMLFLPLDLQSTGRLRRESDVADYFVWLRSELARLDLDLLVALVPDKSTVYGPLLNEPLPDSEQAAAFLARLDGELAARGVRSLDLTPPLRLAARDGLPRDEYVYWSDDTHWSPRGIGVAAEAILARWTR